jgi:hypothetical protein
VARVILPGGVDEDNRVGVVVDAAEVLMPQYAVIEHEEGKIFASAAARSWNAHRPYMCNPYMWKTDTRSGVSGAGFLHFELCRPKDEGEEAEEGIACNARRLTRNS